MAVVSAKLDSGLTTFEFEDNDGHVFSRFRINPADMALAKRSEETQEFFNTFDLQSEDPGEIAQKEVTLGEKLNYLLGYPSYEDVFGEVGPLTLLPDGKFFVEHVMEKVSETIEPILAERQAKALANKEKYTGKYKGKKAK